MPSADELLVSRIRAGDDEAWEELIARFEGRLLAFVEGRLRNRSAGEDIVQETFIGFLTSLPNYDPRRALEGYLFSIAAHKLTDYLRREGRRPTLPLSASSSQASEWDLPGHERPASALVRSGERKELETVAATEALRDQIGRWQDRAEWQKLMCLELLVVRGWSNKQAAAQLQITEQTVANWKYEFIARMNASMRRQGLSEDVFPELK
ncbi:MAG TPA: RNA polymerase sigma factor [Pirellulales bacterium]|jgi:RNA polymerase sigma-70 factor (ECF subfamily)|nr:RNA polymerase sigma factor [Pirellulales bacterium]